MLLHSNILEVVLLLGNIEFILLKELVVKFTILIPNTMNTMNTDV